MSHHYTSRSLMAACALFVLLVLALCVYIHLSMRPKHGNINAIIKRKQTQELTMVRSAVSPTDR